MSRESPLILASASPRRRELLAALVAEFAVVASGVDEAFAGDPIDDARRLALAKARDVAARKPGAVVIGSDTIVYAGGKAYAKPLDEADALAIWRALRGRPHSVVTAFAVVAPSGEQVGHVVPAVTLASLDDDAVRAYVASGRPMDKAGAYAIQDDDVPTVERLDGCYCSVMGLPLHALRHALQAAGVACQDPSLSREVCRRCPDRG